MVSSSPVSKAAIPSTPFKAQAIWSWGGDNKDRDLGFMEGDIIDVMKVLDQGQWAYGLSLRSKLSGYFPMKYVKLLQVKESGSRTSLRSFAQKHPSAPPSRVSSRFTPSASLTPSGSSSSLSSIHRLNSTISPPQLAQRFPKSPTTSSSSGSKKSSEGTLYSKRSSATQSEDEYEEDDNDLPPPPPPKHEFTQSSTNKLHFTSSYSQHVLDSSTFSTDTERSSFFGHSDFSATSAGSLMRHNEAKSQSRLQDLQENGPNTQERQDLFQRLIDDGNKTRHPKLLKKFLGVGKAKSAPSLDDQIFNSSVSKMADLGLSDFNDEIPFGASASNLNEFQEKLSGSPIKQQGQMNRNNSSESLQSNELKRTKSLSGKERASRKSRVLQEDCYLILQPHKSITSLNSNETVANINTPLTAKSFNIDALPLFHVDKYINKLPNDRFSTPMEIATARIASRYETQVEQLRAIYIYLVTKFDIKHLRDEKLSTKISPSDSKISDLMHSKVCSSHQLTWLFYIMATTLNIETEIILGNMKNPFDSEHLTVSSSSSSALTLNHSWLSVVINGEHRILDPSLGNPTHQTNVDLNLQSPHSIEDNTNFYFLTKPLDILYTHTPVHTDHQHITPMIDPIVQMALPPLYSPFHIHKLRLYKFNQSLFRLMDFEIIEFDLEVPKDVELRCLVKSPDSQRDHDALVQVYWKKGRRLAKIKATLPGVCSIGFACVYVRSITSSCSSANASDSDDFSMALSIPCFHKGKYKEMEWVRFNEKNVELDDDLYIKEPQMFNLSLKHPYNFTVLRGGHLNGDENDPFECHLVSPSGKFYQFDQINEEILEFRKQLREPGCWRMVVPSKETQGNWHVFAEWKCA